MAKALLHLQEAKQAVLDARVQSTNSRTIRKCHQNMRRCNSNRSCILTSFSLLAINAGVSHTVELCQMHFWLRKAILLRSDVRAKAKYCLHFSSTIGKWSKALVGCDGWQRTSLSCSWRKEYSTTRGRVQHKWDWLCIREQMHWVVRAAWTRGGRLV